MESINFGTILILIPITISLIGCSREADETGIEIFPDMVHSQAYVAYSESDITKDGKSMLMPPKGSIARGFIPFHYGPGDKEAIRAGRELINPFKATAKNLERGKHVYDNYCLVCHGEKGKGDGPLIPKFPNPPSLTSKRIKTYRDGRFYHIIVHGAGDMPSHAAQILKKDRWLLVNYLKKLQGRK